MYSRAGQACACLLVLLASCARKTPTPAQRVAVLRFENLSGDPSKEWLARAFTELLTHHFDRAIRLPSPAVAAPGISSQRGAALQAGANRLVLGHFSIVNGMLRVNATVEQGNRIAGSAMARGKDPFQLAEELARQLGATPRPFRTRSTAALEHYVRDEFQAAVAADPDFGAAYVGWVGSALARGDRSTASQVIEQARGRRLTDEERARLDLARAVINNDVAGREQALARLAPAEPQAQRQLAELALARRDYQKATQHLKAALTTAPDDAGLWNALGYAHAAAGSLPSAIDALRRYEALRPAEPNPLDSLGDVHLQHGLLAEAEAFYLKAYEKDRKFLQGGPLLKAAWARLMAGDVARADAHFQVYLAGLAPDELTNLRRAEWDFLSGRRGRALEVADRMPGQRARSQAALWRAATGKGEAATAVNASGNPYLEAVGHLLNRRFKAATPLLQEVERRSGIGGDPAIPVLLAWAYVESGRHLEAAPLLRYNPIPRPVMLDAFTSLWFPRLFALRAAVLESQGRPQDAEANAALYRKLSHP